MEATQEFNSKKRKRSYNPFIGIFTRSKSQIYLHSNRSGRSRTDSFRQSKHHTILRSHSVGFQIQSSCNKKLRRKSATQASVDDEAEDWSKLLIKDLRAKRVFSLDDCGLCLDTEEKNGSEKISGEFQNEISSESMNYEDMKSDCLKETKDGNPLDLDMKNEEANELGDEDDKASNKIGDCIEECVQATPPDAEILNLRKIEARQGINDQKMANNSEPNLGPYPWSRVEVFKIPGSLGYRRMLPYLKDTVQDNDSPGTDSNSVSVERNFDSSVLLDSQKDSKICSPTLPVDVGCSATVDEVHEKIKLHVYREDQNLETMNPDCSTREEKPMSGNSNRNNAYSADKIMNYRRNKVGLNPCSRLKLFKAESSFSYRRLLPYLSNIAKENSVDSGTEHCIKFEKRLEETPVSKLPASEMEKIPLEKINGKSHNADDDSASCTMQMDISLATNVSSSTNQQSLMLPSALQSRAVISTDAIEEPESQVVDVTSDHIGVQLDNSLSVMGLVNEGRKVIVPLSEDTGENSKTLLAKIANDAEPVQAGCLSQTSSKIEATDSMGMLAYDSKKGILKKHPRGCRGLCTCLNCASFRLHAERAFEFSKNQMQDVEEIALDLIKELSYLRNTLEKAAVGSDGQLVVCINQVKKACEKAIEAEEIAKTRLSQMNYDLDIHCRIRCGDRPRVRFSNDVEERIISQVNSKK